MRPRAVLTFVAGIAFGLLALYIPLDRYMKEKYAIAIVAPASAGISADIFTLSSIQAGHHGRAARFREDSLNNNIFSIAKQLPHVRDPSVRAFALNAIEEARAYRREHPAPIDSAFSREASNALSSIQ